MGGRGKGAPQAISLGVRGLCYTHCKAPILGGRHMIGSVFTQAMFVERLATMCLPCGGSVMESALACGGEGGPPLPRQHRESAHPLFCASARNDMHRPTGSPLTSICHAVSSNHREGWEMQRAEVGRASQVKGGPRRVETSSR